MTSRIFVAGRSRTPSSMATVSGSKKRREFWTSFNNSSRVSGAVPNHFRKPRIPHDGLGSSCMIFPKDSMYQMNTLIIPKKKPLCIYKTK